MMKMFKMKLISTQMCKSGIHLGLVILLALFAFGAEAQTYRKTRSHFQQNPVPDFAKQQVQEQSQVAEPFQLQWQEAKVDLEPVKGFEQPQDRGALQDIYQKIAPLLTTQNAQEIQSQAQSSDAAKLVQGTVTLDTLITVASVRNPMIRSASEAWQAALNRYSQASYLEGILRQFNTFTRQLDTQLGMMQPQRQMVAEDFPFPGISALKGNLIQNEVAMARQDYVMAVRDALTEVKMAFYEYVYIRKAIGVAQENLDLLQQMLDVVSIRFEAANASYSDVIKARMQLAKVENSLRTMQDEERTIRVRINSLLDLPSSTLLGAPQEARVSVQKLDLNELQQLARENRQEILSARLAVENTGIMIEMAEQMNRPEPTTGASYFDNRSALVSKTLSNGASSMNGGRGMNGAESFMITPRIATRPWFGERESYIQEMRNRKQELEHRLQGLINEAELRVKESHFALSAAQRDVSLYSQTLVPDAYQALEVAQTDYQNARVEFLDYLDAIMLWLDTNMQYYEAQMNLGQAVATLEQTVGAVLQK